MTALVIPDLIEPVLGYRSWTVRIHPSGEPRLCSPYRRTVWAPGTPEQAHCSSRIVATAVGFRQIGPPDGPHTAPGDGCTCGVHAWRLEDAALADAAGAKGLRAVTGDVALWGVVLRHERGWRAERAYPSALRVHAATTDGLCFVFSWEAGELRAVPAEELAPALAETYGVPVTIDPAENPLGPLPRHAPAAQRLPRAHLDGRALDDEPSSRTRIGDRIARWFTLSP